MTLHKTKLFCIAAAPLLLAVMLSGCSFPWFDNLFGNNGIVISEVCTSNSSSLVDDELGTPDWIELYNGSRQAIDLKGYALSDNIKSPVKYILPEVSMQPGAYLIVYCTKLTSKTPNQKICTGFKLSSSGTMVILTASGGDTLQKLDVPQMSPDQTYARDGSGNYHVTAKPTPGAANTIVQVNGSASIADMPNTAPVHITEVMVKNGYSITDEDGDRSGWVEIENTSSSPVSLEGYRLSDDASSPSKWSFPDVNIAPGQYMVIFCSGKDKVTQNGQIHTSFNLSKNDAQICLLDMAHMQMQTVVLPADLGENVSYGVQNGQWVYFGQPTPGQPNTTKGFTSIADAKLFDPNGLYISEVSATQAYESTSLDWVELHNGGQAAVNLAGYYLSDDMNNLKKGKIGNISIPAGGYVAISCSGNVTKQGGGVMPFGIATGGETIAFSMPDGSPLDVFQVGVTRPGITCGRNTGDASGARVFFSTPTKAAANGRSAVTGYVQTPTFSVPGGIQSAAVNVSIQTATPNARIYYTTDGSTPTVTSNLYRGPIGVGSSTPLRAIAICDGWLSSDVTTATYLFDKAHTIPVVCLSMSPSDFTTMYANTKTYINIERPGNVEYYDTDGALGTVFPASVRVQGWSSRSFDQKSLCFKMDDAFGKGSITYPFFDGYNITTFSSLIVRSGGQDRYKAYVRDAFFAHVALMPGVDADTQNTRFVAVYINGKYWGLYDLREDIGSAMLGAHHDVDSATVNYMRRSVVQHGSNASWQMICNYGRTHNLNDPSNYAQFCQWVDVNAWADYLVLRNYFRETDLFNQKYWDTTDWKIKLRPIYFDNDYSIGGPGALSTDLIPNYLTFSGFTTKNGTFVNMDVTASLWTSSQFRQLFVQRWVALSKTVFQATNLVPLLDSMEAEMEPEMQRQIDRWGTPTSMAGWKSDMDELRTLLKERPTSAKQLIQKNFNLTDTQMDQLYK